MKNSLKQKLKAVFQQSIHEQGKVCSDQYIQQQDYQQNKKHNHQHEFSGNTLLAESIKGMLVHVMLPPTKNA